MCSLFPSLALLFVCHEPPPVPFRSMGANQAKEAELDDKGNGQREYTAADSKY